MTVHTTTQALQALPDEVVLQAADVIAFIGIPGGPEMLLIVGIAVLLFGANKIPKIARSVGQAGGEFKKGRKEIEEELSDVTDTETTNNE